MLQNPASSSETSPPVGSPPRKRRHRKWPYVVLGVGILIILAAWIAVSLFADDWIANHGKDTAALPATPPFANARTVVYSQNLGAWYAPPQAGQPTVIIVHGYGANRTDHAAVGVALQQHGYGVMAIDLGYESSGPKYGGGSREARDVEAAVAYAHAQGSTHVVLLGYSAGGTESVLAASNGGGVNAVVADSSPVSFIHLASDRVGIPTWLFTPASWFYGSFSSGGSLGSLSSVPTTYQVPTLVIQGTADKTVDPSNGPAVAQLTRAHLWTVPGVGHTATYEHCPSAYDAQLLAFYTAALTGHAFVLQPAC